MIVSEMAENRKYISLFLNNNVYELIDLTL